MASTDRDALVALYNATDGANWTKNRNWNIGDDLSQWRGIIVNDDGRVVQLQLTLNNLQGPIPEALEALSELRIIQLSNNKLTGPIPEALGALSELRILKLSDNELTGPIPEALRALSELRILKLSNCELTGPIPEALGALSELRILKLSNNEVTGPIPEALGALSELRILELSNNEVTGPIPEALGALSELKILELSSNKLTGPIPEALGALSELGILKLSNNEVTGPIPEALGALSKLEELRLYSNKLTGPIPEALGALSELEILELSSNKLTGPIPEALGALSKLMILELSSNKLTGEIPEQLGKLTGLTELDLEQNRLSGAIPLDLCNLGKLQVLRLEYNDLVDTQQRVAGEQDSRLDGLGYERYADCLIKLFRNNKDGLLPAAVGIYAPWGSGKSFLLRMLKEELGKPFGPRGACWFRWRSHIKAFTRSLWVVVIRFAFCALLKCCWRKQNDGKNDAPGQPEEMEAGSSSHCWPGWSCIRTSTPPSQRQFVFVEFNAWECAGSEVLWAALITKIFDTVEDTEEFGRGAVREKRIEKLLDQKMWDWCGIATCFAIIAAVVLAVLLVLDAVDVVSGIAEAWERSTALVLGIPGVLTVLQLVSQMRSIGVFDTAQSALRQAADRKQSVGESRLGFMSEVKKELDILFKVINDHNEKVKRNGGGRGFTLSVIIDDLDRCPSDKIMLMLQAMHLLLEQPHAPMVVFLAVDPRIVVSAIETSLADVSNEVTGLQYLDKIIHIPFCIPRICEETRLDYVDGLLNLKKAARGRERKEGEDLVEIKLEKEEKKEEGGGLAPMGADVVAEGPTEGENDNSAPVTPVGGPDGAGPETVDAAADEEEEKKEEQKEPKGGQEDSAPVTPVGGPDSAGPETVDAAADEAEEKKEEQKEPKGGQEDVMNEVAKPTGKIEKIKVSRKNKTIRKEDIGRMEQFLAQFVRRGLSMEEGEMLKRIFSFVEATPRKIKRVVNVYALQLLLAPAALKTTEARVRFAKWTMLAEFWPLRLLCIVNAMRVDERKTQGQQNTSTIRTTYSKDGSNSVRGRIREFRRETMNKNSEQEGISKRDNRISKRDPHLYDESEEGFLAALGMDKGIPKREEITQRMVLDPENGFLQYCLNLNPAITSIVEAAMRGDGL